MSEDRKTQVATTEISKPTRVVGWIVAALIAAWILVDPFAMPSSNDFSLELARRVMFLGQVAISVVIPFRYVFITENFGRGVFLGWGMFVLSYGFGMICGGLGIIEFDGIGMLPSMLFGWLYGLWIAGLAVVAHWFTRIRIVRRSD